VKLVHTAAELRREVDAARRDGKSIGFVPTMGALHDGHISLLKIAQQRSEFTVASIFVNPLQFGQGEDFDRYPRTLGVDARLLTDAGAGVLFAPTASEVYPEGVTLASPSAGPVGEAFEGAARPGHFDGMLKVVSRLFDLVAPDVAVFGAKDAQQLFLVRQMVGQQVAAGQRAPLKIVAGPTVRDVDGLALSSRNRFLSDAERAIATSIPAALRAATDAAATGASARVIRQHALDRLHPEIRLGYLELVDLETFQPVPPDFTGTALLIFAGQVGATRLLDNLELQISPEATRADQESR
jgi:pantoate--beta-alanine ligase